MAFGKRGGKLHTIAGCPGRWFRLDESPSAGTRGAVAQLGERLNGIQEVDGSTPFSSTASARSHDGRLTKSFRFASIPNPWDEEAEVIVMPWWRLWLVMFAFVGLAISTPGCAGRQPERQIERPASIERPAKPISEEEGLADKSGEVMVVLLVVGLFVAGILIPILLL